MKSGHTWRTATIAVGFAVVGWGAPYDQASAADRTRIDGEFEGCDYDQMYALTDGRILVCGEYQYQYAYSPEVIVLDEATVLIDKKEYRAATVAGNVYRTNVSAEFNGCEHDKYISFDNGLIFQCSTYHYQYAYRPKVEIFVISGQGYQVTIHGKKYAGKLFKR
ncbi:hypothetical protein [Microvirga lotononidis]|uniref:Uncharacterized protein n=1 Tax=Microvirga lotononidis TaxID=864069 RepID=I4YRT0_9HYPH|nr:hypothetical protein [Microvirga lotononidis]EIM26672.1 hypothetical protein MicloDRAFT_00032220 [Microvirga lotononidis]WQO32097.1 hypothetical protein U0023_35195 [Microvirga lotononidis]